MVRRYTTRPGGQQILGQLFSKSLRVWPVPSEIWPEKVDNFGGGVRGATIWEGAGLARVPCSRRISACFKEDIGCMTDAQWNMTRKIWRIWKMDQGCRKYGRGRQYIVVVVGSEGSWSESRHWQFFLQPSLESVIQNNQLIYKSKFWLLWSKFPCTKNYPKTKRYSVDKYFLSTRILWALILNHNTESIKLFFVNKRIISGWPV